MALKVNLNKAEQGLRLSLAKYGIVKPPEADLAFALDVSGSFDDEHCEGQTQDLLERLVPWGMVFDPDKKLDVFTYSDGPSHAHRVGDITPETTDGYIRRSIINKVPGYNGGTDYSYVLEMMLQNFGWLPAPAAPAKSGGFMSGLFGKKPAAPSTPTTKRRSIILFVTDGEARRDEERTRQVLRASQQRRDEVYFLFLGVSNQGTRFPFLEQIGNEFDNTGLATIPNLREFVRASDDEVNGKLIGPELIAWLRK